MVASQTPIDLPTQKYKTISTAWPVARNFLGIMWRMYSTRVVHVKASEMGSVISRRLLHGELNVASKVKRIM